MSRPPGFFDLDYRYEQFGESGDPLEHLSELVNFEAFRYRLVKALKRSDGSRGGRPPYDPALMFKILVLQALCNLPDEQAGFMIRDRLSFMRFPGPGMKDPVPDATMIRLFREHITKAIGKIFAHFDKALIEKGCLAMSGQILDATIVPAPRRRNNDDEKQAIKEGRIPEGWEDNPVKLRQRDRNARWTVKFSKAKPREDGRKQRDLAIPNEAHMACHGFVSMVHRKKPRGRPMPERISRATGRKSKVRAHVEHVFAVQKGPMAPFVRTIGMARARARNRYALAARLRICDAPGSVSVPSEGSGSRWP